MDLKQRPGGIVYLNLTFWEEGVNFLPLLLICYVLRIKLEGNIFNLDFFYKRFRDRHKFQAKYDMTTT